MYRQTFYSAFKTLAQTCLFNGMFCFNKKKKKITTFSDHTYVRRFWQYPFKKKNIYKE